MSKLDVRERHTVISDSGKVRIGDMSPSFPAAPGKPANASDSGKVRVGDVAPAFPPVRGR